MFPSSSAPWMHGARHSPAAPREDVWASAWQQVFWKLFTHKVLKEADFGSTTSRKSSSKPHRSVSWMGCKLQWLGESKRRHDPQLLRFPSTRVAWVPQVPQVPHPPGSTPRFPIPLSSQPCTRRFSTLPLWAGGTLGAGENMEKTGGLGGRGRSVGVIGSNVVIPRFNSLV